MKRGDYTPEQIIRKLQDADRLLSQGTSLVEVCKHLEVAEAIYHRWCDQYDGMKADEPNA